MSNDSKVKLSLIKKKKKKKKISEQIITDILR